MYNKENSKLCLCRCHFFRTTKNILFVALTLGLLVSSCGGNGSEDEKADKQIQKSLDSGDVTLGLNGKVFIIPSPIQTAILVQRSGAKYDKSLLNESNKISSYSTKFKKCLNLGVYGADLGYTSLYNQTQDGISYFKAVNTLAIDLGLSGAFDKNLIERFQKNIGFKDSILVLVGSAYRNGNDFLKHNNRNEEAALIIAGGWIETLQIALDVMKTNTNYDLMIRIAEQKSILDNLISLLSGYKGNEEYDSLVSQLNDLKEAYKKVDYKYIFQIPVTDEVNKITSITSKSEVSITPADIKIISEKVTSLRSKITS